MRRALFILGFSSLVVLLLLVLSYLGRAVWTEWLLRRAEGLASRSLGAEVRADVFCWGLGEGIVVKGLRIRTGPSMAGPGETVLSVEEIRVLLEWSELLKGRVILDSVRVVAPWLRIGKDSQGKWIVPTVPVSRGEEKAERGEPLFLKIRRLELEEGGVSLEEAPEPLAQRLQVRLRNFSTGTPERGSFDLSAEMFPRGTIELKGWIVAGDGFLRTEAQFTGKGFSLAPFWELLAPYGLSAEKTVVSWDFACEGNSEEGMRVKGRLALGPVESSFVRGPVDQVSIRSDLFYNFETSSLRMETLEIDAGDVLGAAFQGLFPSPGRGTFIDGTVRIDRVDLCRLRLPGGVLLAGLLSTGPFRVRWDKSAGPPVADGTATIQNWRTSFGGYTVEGPKLEIAFSRENGIRMTTPEPASLVGERAGPLVRTVPFRLSVKATAENKGVKFDGSLRVGALEGRVGREGVISWKKAEWRASGILERERSEARLDGAIQDLRYGDGRLPEVSTGFALQRTDGRILLRQPRIQGEGFCVTAESVHLEQGAGRDKMAMSVKGLDVTYAAAGAEIQGGEVEIVRKSDPAGADLQWGFSCKGGRAQGVPFSRVASSGRVRPSAFDGTLSVRGPESGTLVARVEGRRIESPFPMEVEISIGDWDLESHSGLLAGRLFQGVELSGRIRDLRFDGAVRSPEEITGNLAVEALSLSAARKETGRFLFKDVALKGGVDFHGPHLSWSLGLDCGAVHTRLEGGAESFARPQRRLTGHVTVAPVELAALREAFWDLTPDGMLYVGLEGTASADIDWVWEQGVFGGRGMVTLEQVRLEGEYREFALGPVNGRIPVSYSNEAVENWAEPFPDFQRSTYERLLQELEFGQSVRAGSQTITIGEVAAGFPLVQNLELSVCSGKGWIRVDRVAGEAFGGSIRGLAAVRACPDPRFKVGLVAQGIRLSSLCEAIQPIQGYLSGCVDGTVRVEGPAAGGLAGLSGRAEFWTYRKGCEKTRVSRQLLEKIAGRSMPMLFRDRPFDKGELTVLLSRGFMVFQDLEISNTNMVGITDLSVRVAPQNNRIAVDHLLTSLATAAARARSAQKGP